MTKAKPNWTHVQREVIKCVQSREFLEIMAAGMFWQNTKGHKILSRKKGGKKLPCYPSLTFFCPRWFCLASTSYRLLIGRNFWRSPALKRSGSFGEHKRQLLLFRHYDLWFLWAPAHGNISFKLPRPLPADDTWLVTGKRAGAHLYCTHGTLNRASPEWRCCVGEPERGQDLVSRNDLSVRVTPTVCVLRWSGKLNLTYLASRITNTF